MLEFALGFLCALVLVYVYLIILRSIGHDVGQVMANQIKEMLEKEEYAIKKLPGGGTFKSMRPDNKKAQQIRIREGLMEGMLDGDDPRDEARRSRSR